MFKVEMRIAKQNSLIATEVEKNKNHIVIQRYSLMFV